MPGRWLNRVKLTSAARPSRATEIACLPHSVHTDIGSASHSAIQLHHAAEALSIVAADRIAEFGPKAGRQIPKHFPCRVVAWRTGDTTPGMRRGTAHIETGNRHSIAAMTKHGPGSEKLIQLQPTVHNIAPGKAKIPLQIERRQGLAPDDGGPKSRRKMVDGRDHEVGDVLAMVIPRRAIRQDRGDVLTK